MNIWSKLEKVAEYIAEKAPGVINNAKTTLANSEAEMFKLSETRLKEYERKLKRAENSLNPRTKEQAMKIKEARQKHTESKENFYGARGINEGFSLSTWDRKWINIGPLESANLSPYNNCVGLYRHLVDDKTVYIGRAIELGNGGFRKRLSDYRRPSDSGRKHPSGQTIYANLHKITTYILVVGYDEDAIKRSIFLEKQFIAKYKPEWNKNLKI